MIQPQRRGADPLGVLFATHSFPLYANCIFSVYLPQKLYTVVAHAHSFQYIPQNFLINKEDHRATW